MSSTTEAVTSNTVTDEKRVKGVCKWFNNKSGYGFLTITEGEKKDSDIFVYHSSLQVGNENQYKYLVQGEYVDFTVTNVESSKSQGKYEYHATNVTGINGGKLMCETRNESRVSRPKSEITKATFSSKSPYRRLVKNEKETLEKVTEQQIDVLEKGDWSEIKPKDLANKAPRKGRGRPPKSQ
uniref:CSD domain-containing protein n=1 Tax=viral metagenome TaxID=1070528 RepID=A0A6C0EFJ6_9ZZZZ